MKISSSSLCLILIFSVFQTACDDFELALLKKSNRYEVEQGGDSFFPDTPALVRPTEVSFKATLHENTAYDLNGKNQVNKLFGFSDCSDDHHENSARIGWIYIDGKMFVLPYSYANGVRNYKLDEPLGEVQLGKAYEYSIAISGENYIFKFKNEQGEWVEKTHPRGCSGTNELRYLLQPWFGGETKAPHHMTIDVEFI